LFWVARRLLASGEQVVVVAVTKLVVVILAGCFCLLTSRTVMRVKSAPNNFRDITLWVALLWK
jgi:flagellar motor component MotA